MGFNKYSVVEANNIALGQTDFLEISSETKAPPTGTIFVALVSDTNAIYSANTKGGDNASSQTRNAGSIRFGRFTSVIESNGGVVWAYYAEDV